MTFSRNFVFLSIISFFLFACGGDSDEPTPAKDVTGKWQLDFIYTKREQAGESPLQASINPTYGRFLTLNADGSCSLTQLGLSEASFDFFSKNNYAGVYTVNGDILELQIEKEGHTEFELFKVKTVNEEMLRLDQDKSLILQGLEKNKVWLSDEKYNEELQYVNQYQDYEVEVEFLKE